MSSSLWGCELKNVSKPHKLIDCCHPPCEDVSWKTSMIIVFQKDIRSSSLWGCELKNIIMERTNNIEWSSSLWGCELKNAYASSCKETLRHPPCEDVSWKNTHYYGRVVSGASSSLWGCELKSTDGLKPANWVMSSSLWGCELKIFGTVLLSVNTYRHPPCEDVSWKVSYTTCS